MAFLLCPRVCSIFSTCEDMHRHTTDGDHQEFCLSAMLGKRLCGNWRCQIFSGLRRCRDAHREMVAEADRTGHHVTARGPDAPSQDGKWSLPKVNMRIINGGRSRCHVERMAPHPHSSKLRPILLHHLDDKGTVPSPRCQLQACMVIEQTTLLHCCFHISLWS